MLFSCKITHSVITYLDRRGEDLELLYEKCDWPAEFLRDPASWLEADKMENLLRQIDQEYGRNMRGDETFIEAVGHQCKDLRSWGVLDSVLRMVQTPKDLYAQPERFLSYFVSPAPPVGEIRRAPESVSFVLPVSEVQFPFVTSYLRAALEALPTYINKSMGQVRWENSRVSITWSEQQESLFSEAQNTELSLHPELVRNILLNLEDSQKQVEEIKKELLIRDKEIERLKNQGLSEKAADAEGVNFTEVARGLKQEVAPPLAQLLNELYRIGDYMARGQQMVTLLIGQGRGTSQVQEAMRRVDWSYVASEGPQVLKRAVETLQGIQGMMRDLDLVAEMGGSQEAPENEGPRTPCDLNELVSSAIEAVEGQASNTGKIQIDRHLLLDRQVDAYPARLRQAVVNLLNNAVASGGAVRVVTRPRGQRAEIEIADMGSASEMAMQAPASPGLGLSIARSIVKMHEGSLLVSKGPERGSTVIVDLPLTKERSV